MKNKKPLILGILLVSGLAWAININIDRASRWIQGSLYVGPHSTTSGHSTNAITKSIGGRVDQTFPAIPDDGGATGDACQISAWGATCGSTAGTCTGATVGDPCFVGIGFGASGVPANDLDSDQFDCFVSSANTVKVRRCGMRGAGARVDAGFSVRVLSNQ